MTSQYQQIMCNQGTYIDGVQAKYEAPMSTNLKLAYIDLGSTVDSNDFHPDDVWKNIKLDGFRGFHNSPTTYANTREDFWVEVAFPSNRPYIVKNFILQKRGDGG